MKRAVSRQSAGSVLCASILSACAPPLEPEPTGHVSSAISDRKSSLGADTTITLTGGFRFTGHTSWNAQAVATLEAARIVTWPEGTVVPTITVIDTNRTWQWSDSASMLVHLRSVERFEPRWYAIEIDPLPPQVHVDDQEELPRSPSGAVRIRFRPDAHLLAHAIRFSHGENAEQLHFAVDLSEAAAWHPGDPAPITVTTGGRPVDCDIESPPATANAWIAFRGWCRTRGDEPLTIAFNPSLVAWSDGSALLSPSEPITATPHRLPRIAGTTYSMLLP